MAAFKAGQRVRIVKSYPPYSMVGTECRIVRWVDNGWNEHENRRYSGWLLDVKNTSGHACAAEEWQLEPITPDGHRASEFSFTELMDRCREGVSA